MELNPAFGTETESLAPGSADENGHETQTTIKKTPTTVVDSAGDVILSLGDVSLLISSKVLSVASPVFRVMFGPHFQEGEALSRSNSTAPAVIPLLDDDPTAMKILCQVLHHQTEAPYELFAAENISGLRNLATVSDKYSCAGAVSLATNAWIQAVETQEPKATQDELFHLLEVAYILDHPVLFERVSKRILISDIGGILERMIGWTTENFLPIKVYGELEKRRRNIYTELSKGLQDPIANLVGKPEYQPTATLQDKQYGCVNHTWHKFNLHDALQISSYVRELKRVNIWPFDAQKHNLDVLISAFNKFEDRDISQFLGFAIFPKDANCQACMLDTRSQLANLKEKIRKSCRGLCLDCIDKGRLGEDEVECRIKHEKA
ncbi:hypothetical protein N431DRAFT_501229 [Stipitochalara longipes BDJ]|nr:hypothetical protein N431DRAFT_501229 [Stipitochalara longipes BDJ]